MRSFPIMLIAGSLLCGFGALAADKKPAAKPAATPASAPQQSIGTFDDWQAATHVEAGQTVCYAFTRAKSSSRKLAGRGDVVLTVTRRAGVPDAVALNAGYAYAANAAVAVQIETATQDFYTAQRYAFARDGHATVVALLKSNALTAKSPVAKAADVVDSFSLKGFKAAYDAVNKACPAK